VKELVSFAGLRTKEVSYLNEVTLYTDSTLNTNHVTQLPGCWTRRI